MDPFSVLLVDDELDFVGVLAMRLKRRGLTVRQVHTAEDGLLALADEPADVVVLDVRLPGMTGVQALQKIKARYPSIEVVMLTGYADTETSVRVLAGEQTVATVPLRVIDPPPPAPPREPRRRRPRRSGASGRPAPW